VLAVGSNSPLGIFPEVAPVALHVVVQFVEEMQQPGRAASLAQRVVEFAMAIFPLGAAALVFV
jgi:hypothetical protein